MSLDVTCLDTITAVNRNQWNHAVEQSDLGSAYHRYGWLRAIESGTRFEPRHLVVSKKDNPIGVFPNFVVESERTPLHQLTSIKVGSGGPVVVTDERTAMDRLLEAVPEACSGTVVSNRIDAHTGEYVRYHDLFRQHGYGLTLEYCDLALDLDRGWEAIRGEMDSSRRRAISQGHGDDVAVRDEAITGETTSQFFEWHAAVMDRVGGETLPRSFFRELREFSERVKMFSLVADGAKRGMLLFLLNDEQSTVHYVTSAVTEDHFAYNASELIHERAVRWAIDEGYGTYRFGGTDPDFRDGLFRFKEKFGARPVPLLTWERGCSKVVWPAYRAGRALYRRVQG